MARGLVIESETGRILGQYEGDPAMLAAQVRGPGEVLFVVAESQFGLIQDSKVFVDASGNLAAQPGADLDLEIPEIDLQFVPT